MTREIVTDALLAVAVLVVLLSALGVLLMRDVYQKLHYVAPISVLAPLLVALAVLVRRGWSEDTLQSWLTLGLLVLAGPFLSHVTMRVARGRQSGDWREPTGDARAKDTRC